MRQGADTIFGMLTEPETGAPSTTRRRSSDHPSPDLADAASGAPSGRKLSLAVVAALAAGQFLVGLDASVATVALPRIQRELGASAPQLQWVLMAYVVAGAALALPVGALGDRLGRKRLYLGGAGLFAVGSLASALAPSMSVLIGARALQGVGAAALGSLALAMLTTSVDKDRIGSVVGIWTAVSTAAMALGPLIGGLLVQSVGWRWVFGINVPLALAVLVVAAAKLPSRPVRDAAPLEWIGSALVTIALISLSLGLNAAEKTGFASVRALLPIAIGLGVVAVAALQQRRAKVQMLDWSQLSRRPVPAALVLSVLLGLALSGSLFQLTLLLQNALGFSPAECGLVTLGATASFIILSPLSGKLAKRFGLAPLTCTGLALAAVGMFLLSRVGDSTAAWVISADLAVLGADWGSRCLRCRRPRCRRWTRSGRQRIRCAQPGLAGRIGARDRHHRIDRHVAHRIILGFAGGIEPPSARAPPGGGGGRLRGGPQGGRIERRNQGCTGLHQWRRRGIQDRSARPRGSRGGSAVPAARCPQRRLRYAGPPTGSARALHQEHRGRSGTGFGGARFGREVHPTL